MRLSGVFRQKITPSMYFSAAFFLVCMSLDFYFTNTVSQGNSALEANPFGRLWWEMTGPFRFIEIPIYVTVILGAAYIINFKSKFFPLFWLNLLAFNHLLGVLSWLPGVNLNFIYSLVKHDWAIGYAFSFVSIFLSLPLTLLQLTLSRVFKKIH